MIWHYFATHELFRGTEHFIQFFFWFASDLNEKVRKMSFFFFSFSFISNFVLCGDWVHVAAIYHESLMYLFGWLSFNVTQIFIIVIYLKSFFIFFLAKGRLCLKLILRLRTRVGIFYFLCEIRSDGANYERRKMVGIFNLKNFTIRFSCDGAGRHAILIKLYKKNWNC